MPLELLGFIAFGAFAFWLVTGLICFADKKETSKGGDAGRISFVCSIIFALSLFWIGIGNSSRKYKDYEVHVKVDNGRAIVDEDIERFDGINLNKQFSQQFYDGEIITIREHDTDAGSVHFERYLELVENKEEVND